MKKLYCHLLFTDVKTALRVNSSATVLRNLLAELAPGNSIHLKGKEQQCVLDNFIWLA